MTDTNVTDAEFQEVDSSADATAQTPKSEIIDDAPTNAREAIQQARALIPVGPSGATPMNFAQQCDYAKTMAQARASLPAHLVDSPGDCLAIIDIASRANLSPFMVAGMTYFEPRSKRLSFMSQLYHALLMQSRKLVGDLDVEYSGDGEERTCTVSGKLRSDGKVRTHTSPPLGKVRPPMNDRGTARKGSPLWDKKPDVQLFYDTSRDWVRIHCPTATLGIFAPEEFEETPVGPDAAKDVTGLAQRLVRQPGAEGYADGHAERELAELAPDRPGATIEGGKSPAEGAAAAAGASATRSAASGATSATPGAGTRASDAPKPKRHRVPAAPPSRAAVQKVADKAEAASAKKAEPAKPAPPPIPTSAKACKTPDDYVAYARAWIDASTKHAAAMDRFDEESAVRHRLKVPIKIGAELQSRIEHKFGGA